MRYQQIPHCVYSEGQEQDYISEHRKKFLYRIFEIENTCTQSRVYSTISLIPRLPKLFNLHENEWDPISHDKHDPIHKGRKGGGL